MSTDKEAFLSRWSRRKREAAATPPAVAPAKPASPQTPAAAQPPVELPPLDQLTFDSDFSAFLKGNVEERVKRAALKKLFSDPHFNVMDGLDVYIDDYTKNDPIPEEMLKTLEHARSTLFGPQAEAQPEPSSETQAEQTAKAPQTPQNDQENVDPKQDA